MKEEKEVQLHITNSSAEVAPAAERKEGKKKQLRSKLWEGGRPVKVLIDAGGVGQPQFKIIDIVLFDPNYKNKFM